MIKKIQIILIALFVLLSVTHAQTVVSGSLLSLIDDIVTTLPANGSNGFVTPSNNDLSYFQNLFIQLKNKNYSGITGQLSAYNYVFLKFIETSTSDTFYIFKENTPIQRGWGTYIFNERGLVDFTVEIPHAADDFNTERIGVKLLLKMKAKYFIMTGAHRNATSNSDVAHETQTVFHSAHKTFASEQALQIHGFSKSNPGYAGYPDIVISNGTLYPVPLFYTLQTNYINQGYTAGVFSIVTYNSLSNLGATTNVQGQWSNSNGKLFCHVEHEYDLRKTTSGIDKIVTVLNQTFGNPSVIRENYSTPKDFSLGQNYPNPFNSETVITINIKNKNRVRLLLYNILGVQLKELLNNEIEPGIHILRFDASDLPSGNYFYSLFSNEILIDTRKLTLIR